MRYITKSDLLIVARDSGYLMIGIGIMCLVPLIFDLIYFEFDVISFVIPAAISIALGVAFKKYFTLSTNIPIVDGVFESMSALTGTGITMFEDVEILPHSILFFRALEQWIGGLGVVVMVIGVLTKPGSVSSKLYQSEARDERIKPSIKTTLQKTLEIYAIYTVFGVILYVLAGMPLFDSICNSFHIISTGGMSIKNANMGYYQNDV